MQIKMVLLKTLRDELKNLDKKGFRERYPGVFLLAMGFLAVEKIIARTRTGRNDPTAAITFGAKLKHDAGQSHPLAGQVFLLQPASELPYILIGRKDTCQIEVPDASVSEEHCRVVVSNDGAIVYDCNSTNGTSINLERLEPNKPRILDDEDILSLGRYSFQYLRAGTLFDELGLILALSEGA